MIKTYIDSEGIEVTAQQLTGPLTIKTVNGEQTGHEGQWLLHLPDNLIVFLDDDQFVTSFNEVL